MKNDHLTKGLIIGKNVFPSLYLKSGDIVILKEDFSFLQRGNIKNCPVNWNYEYVIAPLELI